MCDRQHRHIYQAVDPKLSDIPMTGNSLEEAEERYKRHSGLWLRISNIEGVSVAQRKRVAQILRKSNQHIEMRIICDELTEGTIAYMDLHGDALGNK